MVDLKPKANQEFREFKPSGLVNKSKKKREKRLAKKNKEKELKAQEEQKAREKQMEQARKAAKSNKDGEKSQVLTPEGKKLISKTVAKKKVIDSKGDEWEIVDQRKTVIVEESSSEDASDSN